MQIFPADPRIRSPHGVESYTRRSQTWNGVTVHALEFHIAQTRSWSDLSSEQTSLSIVLDQAGPGRIEPRLKRDQPLPAGEAGPRGMSLIPGGMTLWGHTEGIYYVREVRLDIDFVTLSGRLGEKFDRLQTQTPRTLFRDERVWRLGALLAEQVERPDEYSPLYAESLMVALFIDLLRLGDAAERAKKPSGLAPWQLRRVVEYLQANLAASVHLEELAALTGLSQSQFGRAFKASTGVPPHRWQLNARIERAKELLLEGRLSLAEIALVTGFAEQSHFTRVFRGIVGTSPGAWQRARRS
ncbi:AraC family transcriptional regulator [Polyangium aurulentum]|uniref:AraC family transcriptional regulator n=1 Tax=Polyangium aurulentum TaxID=2567896 RepID=UPI0010AE761C|nr:AraC family transcriptional regulator [Polyangium aurulentum]UQA59174.1 AraC family transcriptional regulator [Polyangium aurulentum]